MTIACRKISTSDHCQNRSLPIVHRSRPSTQTSSLESSDSKVDYNQAHSSTGTQLMQPVRSITHCKLARVNYRQHPAGCHDTWYRSWPVPLSWRGSIQS